MLTTSMNFRTFLSLLASFVVCTDGKQQLRRRRTNDDSGTASSIRMMVTYHTPAGRQLAVEHATQIYSDLPHEKTIVVGMQLSDQAELLRHDQDILSVDLDETWTQQGFFVEEYVPPEDDESDERMLKKDKKKKKKKKRKKNKKDDEQLPYGVKLVQADQLNGKSSVTVCVVDTGAASHPDLDEGSLNGADRNPLLWNRDLRGHGTHIAGTLSATDNTYGVRGVGDIPLYIVRGLDDQGRAFESDIIAALDQCAQSDAKIISLSLGGQGMSSAFQAKLDSLYHDHGMLIFAAVGNQGLNVQFYPAAYSSVVAVAAVGRDEKHWELSNTGSYVELAAPGVGVISTSVKDEDEFDYAAYSGTSMATPHASGVASLLWDKYPQCTNTQIRIAMAASAKDVGAEGCDEKTGFGVIKAQAAMDYLADHPCDGTWGTTYHQGGCSLIQ